MDSLGRSVEGLGARHFSSGGLPCLLFSQIGGFVSFGMVVVGIAPVF